MSNAEKVEDCYEHIWQNAFLKLYFGISNANVEESKEGKDEVA